MCSARLGRCKTSAARSEVAAEGVRTEQSRDEGRPDERAHGVTPQTTDAWRENEA